MPYSCRSACSPWRLFPCALPPSGSLSLSTAHLKGERAARGLYLPSMALPAADGLPLPVSPDLAVSVRSGSL